MFSSSPPSSSKSFLTSTFLSKRFSPDMDTNSACNNIKKRDKKHYSSMGGGTGRSCADTIRRSRQNVAIATQVLSPRAIGSSLKCQRGLGAKHFGPADDDEEGFLTIRRRTEWKRLFYYGLSVVAVILVITALIIAMGFLQSEKQKRIITRSPSLKQFHERKSTSYIYNTTPDPTESLEPTESQEFLPTASSSFLVSSTKEESSKEDNGSIPKAISEEARQQFLFKEHRHFSSSEKDFELDGDYKEESSSPKKEDEMGEGKLQTEGFSSFLNGHGHIHYYHGDNEPDDKEESDDDAEDMIDGDDDDSKYGSYIPITSSSFPSSDNSNKDVEESKEKESVNDNINKDTIADNESSEDDWKSSIVGGKNNNEESSHNDEEEAYRDRAALLLTEEVKVLDPQSHTDHDDDEDDPHHRQHHDRTVFSIEVPIYTSNRTINAAQPHSHDYEGEDNESIEVTLELDDGKHDNDNPNSTTIRIKQEIDVDEIADSNKVHEVEVKELDAEQLEEAIRGLNKSSSNDEPEVVEVAATAEDKGRSGHDDDDHGDHDSDSFHRAVLHTALFHLEDDNPEIIKVTPEIIEGDFESDSPNPLSRHEENIHQAKKITPKNRRLENRIRGRNRKIKIFRNDKVMNLKATYNPVGRDQTNLNNTNNTNGESDSDYVNIRDFVPGITRRPIASPSRNFPQLSKSIPQDTSEVVGTGRLLPSDPSTPSLEAILKSIFSTFPPNQEQLAKTFQSSTNDQFNENILNPTGYHQQQQQQPSPSSDFGANFASSLNNIISPSLLFQQGTRPPGEQQDSDPNSSQFRQNPLTALLGGPNAAGASLNNYYAPIFTTTTNPTTPNFDFSSSGTNDSPQHLTLPGVVPFDLSASYIPAGFPIPAPSQYSSSQPTNQFGQAQSQFGQNNFFQSPGSFSPYNFNLNTNEPSNTNNPYQQQFNPANLGGNIGSVTTGSGQPPTYNTISQGIHLLNLISGVMPNTYFHDQVYNPSQLSSTTQSDILGSARASQQSQLPNLAFPFLSQLPNIGTLSALKSHAEFSHSPPTSIKSSTDLYSKNSKSGKLGQNQLPKHVGIRPTVSTIRTVYHFDPDHADGAAPPSDSLIDEDDDQLPAASALSQDILRSIPIAPNPKPRKPSVAISTEIAPLLRSISTHPRTEPKWRKEARNRTQSRSSRSFSFQILPQKTGKDSSKESPGSLIDETLRSLSPEVIHTSLDNFVSESKSKKKASVSLELEPPKMPSYKPISTTPNAIFSIPPSKSKTKNHFKFKEHLKDSSTPTKQKLISKDDLTKKPNDPNASKNLKNKKTHQPPSKKSIFSNNGLKSGFFVV